MSLRVDEYIILCCRYLSSALPNFIVSSIGWGYISLCRQRSISGTTTTTLYTMLRGEMSLTLHIIQRDTLALLTTNNWSHISSLRILHHFQWIHFSRHNVETSQSGKWRQHSSSIIIIAVWRRAIWLIMSVDVCSPFASSKNGHEV